MDFEIDSPFSAPWWSWLLFAAAVAAFFIGGTVAAIRVVGLSTVVGGGEIIFSRSVPYGWSGRPPSGYITGWPAIIFGVLFAVAGVMIGRPVVVGCFFGWIKAACPA